MLSVCCLLTLMSLIILSFSFVIYKKKILLDFQVCWCILLMIYGAKYTGVPTSYQAFKIFVVDYIILWMGYNRIYIGYIYNRISIIIYYYNIGSSL